MKGKPIIGIIGRNVEDGDNSIITVNEDYRLAITKSGGIPLILVPTDILKYGKTLPHDAGKLSAEEKKDLYKVLQTVDKVERFLKTVFYFL